MKLTIFKANTVLAVVLNLIFNFEASKMYYLGCNFNFNSFEVLVYYF